MPRSLPIPWLQWKRYRVEGVVRDAESATPVAGLRVCAFDKDLVYDDFLGECETDAEGRFAIGFTDADFKDMVESKPDLYLSVFRPGDSEPIADTRGELRENAERLEIYEITVPPISPS